ncbi:MAG: hypothetical protein CL398_06275 [Acidiferrobacteraceae bacterium]|nr:hypothetical protein [Acidiferrobacteraceae bacterium]
MKKNIPEIRCLGLLFLLLIASGCGQKGPLTMTNKESEIRFYTLNSRAQQNQIVFVLNASRTGCNDLLVARNVYRVAQFGFSFCEVYEAQGCPLGTEHILIWSGTLQTKRELQPTTRITPGSAWLFAHNSIETVGSWHCHKQE